MSEIFAFRRKRTNEVSSDDVSRRRQWGRLRENRDRVRFPWSWSAASRLMTSRSDPGCREQIGLL